MSEPLTIRRIVERISAGDIRIPAFQRGYVWTPDQAAYLLDSIYKGFPIGTIFLWCTDNRLKTEKNLGRFKLPEPKKDYPVNYVLDGQQRLTSLFSVFQNELSVSYEVAGNEWMDIYFDVQADDGLQDSCFFALKGAEVDSQRHFPMNTIFDSGAYRKATDIFVDEHKSKIDSMQEKFKEAIIPFQTLETDDRNKVAIVFERINREGTELNLYQLLTAWSWSEDFDLQEKFNNLIAEISPFGFSDFSENKDLQLKCCSGVIVGEAAPAAILELNGEDVRNKFEQIENGIKGSIDFLKKELKVSSIECMPYPAMMVPLVTFFATDKESGHRITDNQRKQIIKWFWYSLLTRRYSAGVNKQQQSDIAEFKKLKQDEKYQIKWPTFKIEKDFFLQNLFNTTTVNTKTFVLLLAQYSPKSLISGANVDLEAVLKIVNRNEFHHIFPKKYLERSGIDRIRINCLANFCFITNADNQKIKDKAPGDYKKLIPSQSLHVVMKHAVCPDNALDLDFDNFLTQRSQLLADTALSLVN